MLKHKLLTWTKEQAEEEVVAGRVGTVKQNDLYSFILREILEIEPSVEFDMIECLTIEDWNLDDVTRDPLNLYDIFVRFYDDQNSNIKLVTVNLDGIDVANTHHWIKTITNFIERYDFYDITEIVGYESRLVFITGVNLVSRRVKRAFTTNLYKPDFIRKKPVNLEESPIHTIPYEITITLTIPYQQDTRIRETNGMVSTDFTDVVEQAHVMYEKLIKPRAPGASISIDDSPSNGWDINEVVQICPNCDTAIPRIKYMTEANYEKWKAGLNVEDSCAADELRNRNLNAPSEDSISYNPDSQ